MLHRDLLLLWDKYARHSTVHGVLHAASLGAPKWERALWTAALLAATSGMVLMCIPYLDYVYKTPTTTIINSDSVSLHAFAFPAVSICPANKVRRQEGERLLLRHLGLPREAANASLLAELRALMVALSELEIPGVWFMRKNLKRAARVLPLLANLNITAFMMQTLPRCEDMFSHCFWHGFRHNCCALFHLQPSATGFCYSFNSLTSLSTKECITNEASQNALKTSNTSISSGSQCELRRTSAFGYSSGLQVFLKPLPREQVLRKHAPVIVALHHNTDFPVPMNGYVMPEDATARLALAFLVQNTIASDSLFDMPLEKRQCLHSREIHLQVSNTYSHYSCDLQCRLDALLEACECLPYMFGRKDKPYCNLSQLQCLTKQRRIQWLKPSIPGIANLYTLNCSHCLGSCQVVSFLTEFFLSPKDGHPHISPAGMVDVYNSWPQASKLFTIQAAYELTDILTYLGSVVSLLLGMSILSVVETGYYLGRILSLLVVHALRKHPFGPRPPPPSPPPPRRAGGPLPTVC